MHDGMPTRLLIAVGVGVGTFVAVLLRWLSSGHARSEGLDVWASAAAAGLLIALAVWVWRGTRL